MARTGRPGTGMVVVVALICAISQHVTAWAPAHRRRTPLLGGRRPMALSGATPASAEEFALYNTMSRSKEPFSPECPPKVSFYSCGPTVYDFAHIGNFRAFLTYDVLKRWLTFLGFDVEHVCNLTDIDDKIIARIARDGVSLQELTDKYAAAFFEDLDALNVMPADAYPRATEYVGPIEDMVKSLLSSSAAYEENGSYYFEVSKSAKYGRLARLDIEGMQDGASEGGGMSSSEDFEKRSPRDFALWKAYKPQDGDVSWTTSLGKGRPGWHIECSAMIREFFGDSVDLHAGGIDLVFPHHENEIAQSEAVTGKQFCRHWVHNGFVNVNNEKMSKSKGNFLTLRGTFKTPLEVRAFRYFVVTSQYRMPLNFSPEALAASKSALQRLDRFRTAVFEAAVSLGPASSEDAPSPEIQALVESCLDNLQVAMNDDLNTPRASASLFTLMKKAQPQLPDLTAADIALVSSALDTFNRVLGVFYDLPLSYFGSDEEPAPVPPHILELVHLRAEAKDKKDWATADQLRDDITAAGYAVKDVKGGDPVISKLED